MAKTLADHDFRGAHGNTKYPWAQWANGEVWELTRGEDFDVAPDVMRGQVIVRAKKEGRAVRTNVRDDRVVFAFQRPGESDEDFASRTSPAGVEPQG